MPSAIVDTGMYCSSLAPPRYSGWRGPGHVGDDHVDRRGRRGRPAAAARPGGSPTSPRRARRTAGCRPAPRPAPARTAAWPPVHRLAAAGHPLERVGEVGRQVDDEAGHPVRPRVLLVAGADRHRHHRPQRAVGQRVVLERGTSRSAPAQMAMTTSLTVPPVASFSRLMFASDAERMAKRRWAVIDLFHGVGGAAVSGSDDAAGRRAGATQRLDRRAGLLGRRRRRS